MQSLQENIRKNRLQCPIEDPDRNLFFSLVDYRNNLFTSNDPKKIKEFYSGFKNRDQLIEWMRERPKGASYIHEVEGDKDIIVVIPTADFNGKYAKECRENIFKGLHIIFVESGGRDDFYFNYAHNCNLGIKKAMEYNPRWIVLSNDDMSKIDDVDVLVKELGKLNPEKIDCAFAEEYFDYAEFNLMVLGQPRVYTLILRQLLRHNEDKIIFKVLKKYQVKNNFVGFKNKFLRSLFYKNVVTFINFGDFGIFSSTFIKNNGNILFDEIYMNGFEDVEVSLIINLNHNYDFINYKIRSISGATLGRPFSVPDPRSYREIANCSYFNKKFYNFPNDLIAKRIPNNPISLKNYV